MASFRGLGSWATPRSRFGRVLGRSVICEEGTEQGFDIGAGRLCASGCLLVEGVKTRRGDGVDVSGTSTAVLLMGGGESEFDKLLRLGVQKPFRFRPDTLKAPLGLVCEFIAGLSLETKEGQNCV